VTGLPNAAMTSTQSMVLVPALGNFSSWAALAPTANRDARQPIPAKACQLLASDEQLLQRMNRKYLVVIF
jgi:hypothetical protein